MPKFILRNPDGTVQLDLASQLAKVLGFVDTNSQSSSIVVPGFADGEPWFSVSSNIEASDLSLQSPIVTVDKQSMRLSWISSPQSNTNFRISYGIY